MAGTSGTASRDHEHSRKIISYMWYIHVLVKVNTEERLREQIASFLQEDVTPCEPSPSLACASLAGVHGSDPSDGGGRVERIDDITDYLVLHFFDGKLLGQLVDTVPLLEQADAYAGILVGVPEHFREEFCRRLYVLLFTKRIVEWPPGIEVPNTAAAAAAASPPPEQQLQQQQQQQDDKPSGINKDDREIAGSESERGRCGSLSAAATSTCADGSEFDAEMANAAYFGTANSPLAWNYFSNLQLSRNGYSPLPEGGAADNDSSHHKQLATPHATPRKQKQQQISSPPLPLHKVHADELSDDISPAVATHRLSRANPRVLHHGGGGGGGAVRIRQVGGQDGNHSLRTGFGPAHGTVPALGRALVSDEGHIWGWDWDRGSHRW